LPSSPFKVPPPLEVPSRATSPSARYCCALLCSLCHLLLYAVLLSSAYCSFLSTALFSTLCSLLLTVALFYSLLLICTLCYLLLSLCFLCGLLAGYTKMSNLRVFQKYFRYFTCWLCQTLAVSEACWLHRTQAPSTVGWSLNFSVPLHTHAHTYKHTQ